MKIFLQLIFTFSIIINQILSDKLLIFNKTDSTEFSKVSNYQINLKKFKENFEKINKHGYIIIETIVDVTSQCSIENNVNKNKIKKGILPQTNKNLHKLKQSPKTPNFGI